MTTVKISQHLPIRGPKKETEASSSNFVTLPATPNCDINFSYWILCTEMEGWKKNTQGRGQAGKLTGDILSWVL